MVDFGEVLCWVLLLGTLVLGIRTLLVVREIRRNASLPRGPPRRAPIPTLVVRGSGGHTTEMLHLLGQLDANKYTPLTYVVASTDTTSLRRVEAGNFRRANTIYQIPRSREVGQSYWTSIGTTLWSLCSCVGLVLRTRPGLLLCNGPGTCLPIAVWVLVARIVGWCEGKIVFVESFCRVTRYEVCAAVTNPMIRSGLAKTN